MGGVCSSCCGGRRGDQLYVSAILVMAALAMLAMATD